MDHNTRTTTWQKPTVESLRNYHQWQERTTANLQVRERVRGREGGRGREREGGREGGREREGERGREGGREGERGREGGREGEREGGREGGREGRGERERVGGRERECVCTCTVYVHYYIFFNRKGVSSILKGIWLVPLDHLLRAALLRLPPLQPPPPQILLIYHYQKTGVSQYIIRILSGSC